MTTQRPDDDEMTPRKVDSDGDKQPIRKMPGKKNTASDEWLGSKADGKNVQMQPTAPPRNQRSKKIEKNPRPDLS